VTTVILGGGLTGLTVARLLHERGEDVTVLEKEETIGGLCRSRTEDGFTFDTGGSHIIFSRDAEVLSFMQDVLEENKDTRERNTKIFYKGQFVKYPFENGLADLPAEDRFFCLNEYITTMLALERGDLKEPENFKEWIYYTFGRGIAESYMVPYNEKIWNYPTDKMSLHWVDGRIPRPPVEDIIRSACGIETEGYTHQSIFTYPIEGGIEAMIHAIAKPIRSFIRAGSAVVSLRKKESQWEVTLADGSVLLADHCISTIPLQHLLPCLESVPDTIRDAVSALKYNSIICVGVGLSKELPSYSWLYVPEKELGAFNRISFPSNFSVTTAPDGCSSVLLEITCNNGDELYNLSDSDVTHHAIEGLIKMGFVSDKEEVVATTVSREEFAYVVYDLDYQKNIKTIRDYFESQNIDLLGRFSEFEYLNMDGIIRHVFDYLNT